MDGEYDALLVRTLRRVQPEFSYIAPGYARQLPSELTWVLVCALMQERGLPMRRAAQVVLNFCNRRGEEIPALINRPQAAVSSPSPFCH